MRQGSKKVIIMVFVLVIISLGCGFYIYSKMRGSTKEMDLKEYYALNQYGENAIPLIINNQILSNKAYFIDNEVYIEHEVASTMISSKLYWDSNENMLILTTPTEIIKAKAESKAAEINGTTGQDENKVIVKKIDDNNYAISLSYMKKYVNIEDKIYESPKRVVITSDWGSEVTKIKVVKNDVIRYKGDKNSDILVHAKKNDVLYVMQEEVHNFQRYIYVMTKDGIAGYIKNRNIGKAYKEELKKCQNLLGLLENKPNHQSTMHQDVESIETIKVS